MSGARSRSVHDAYRSGAEPCVLVVIPCLDEADHLPGLVARLTDQTPAGLATIVIADGGSIDGTVEIAERLVLTHVNVAYVHNPAKIQSAAVDLAVERFAGDCTYLVRIDAHAGYPDGYVDALVAVAETTGADSVVVSMNTVGESGFQRSVARAQNSKLGNGGSAHRNAARGRWVDHGHHALFRLASFRAIGGYDETYSHNEDVELDIRLARADGRIWLTDEPTIEYYPRTSAAALFRQYLNFGRGVARTRVKHRLGLKPRQAAPLLVAPAIVIVFPAILAAVFVPSIAWMGIFAVPGIAWALACGLAGVAWRDPRAGLALAVMHLGWSAGFWRGLFDVSTWRQKTPIAVALTTSGGSR
jgi:succinoglycan biosynthesis protein ExoA